VNAPCHVVSFGLSGCPYFSTLSQKQDDFREKVTEQKMRFYFHTNFVSNISHSKKSLAGYCHTRTNVIM